MKKINIYFNGCTKQSVAHLFIDDSEDIESYIKLWQSQGYAKVHYMSDRIAVYMPWNSIIYAQYSDEHDVAHSGEF